MLSILSALRESQKQVIGHTIRVDCISKKSVNLVHLGSLHAIFKERELSTNILKQRSTENWFFQATGFPKTNQPTHWTYFQKVCFKSVTSQSAKLFYSSCRPSHILHSDWLESTCAVLSADDWPAVSCLIKKKHSLVARLTTDQYLESSQC